MSKKKKKTHCHNRLIRTGRKERKKPWAWNTLIAPGLGMYKRWSKKSSNKGENDGHIPGYVK